ncbi:cupin domain-containing protein [Sesbania bispinosa]|nr:cupin domain-containing protein [Sesbania bispinosa]
MVEITSSGRSTLQTAMDFLSTAKRNATISTLRSTKLWVEDGMMTKPSRGGEDVVFAPARRSWGVERKRCGAGQEYGECNGVIKRDI